MIRRRDSALAAQEEKIASERVLANANKHRDATLLSKPLLSSGNKPDEQTNEAENKNGISSVLTLPVMVPAGFLFLGTSVFGFVEPIYAVHAQEYLGLNVLDIGYIFALLNVCGQESRLYICLK